MSEFPKLLPQIKHLTVEEAYQLGCRRGREELLEELRQLLGIEEYVLSKIAQHKEISHDG